MLSITDSISSMFSPLTIVTGNPKGDIVDILLLLLQLLLQILSISGMLSLLPICKCRWSGADAPLRGPL
jgi:hypothetical protein